MPVFEIYRNPTSSSARRRSARKASFVSGFLERERSRIGMEANDIFFWAFSAFDAVA